MAATAKTSREKTLMSTYADIQRCGQNGDYERAIKAANRVLHMEPQERLAFHCKIVCLIQLSKFEEALQQFKKQPLLSENLQFEQAYCYYRLNKHTEALDIINSLGNNLNYNLKELKAQVLYRLEDYSECVKIYRDIIKNTSDEYEDEHQTNMSAALVFLDKDETSSDIDNLKEDNYEISFNKACWLAQNGQYIEAEKKLRHCEKLCRESLEEDEATEEEIAVDLALIRIQLGYVYHKQGRVKEAHQLYTSNLKIKLEDAALIAVASNNVVCINKDQNIFDSKKKIKNATNDQLIHKLPSNIRKHIALNNAIFVYYTNQYEQSIKLCNLIEQSWPELYAYTKALTALNLVKMEKLNEAIKILKESANKDNNTNTFLKLCCVHLHLMQADKAGACKILEDLGENTYKPGIVGALITIYLNLGKEDTALKVFERTVDWYRKNKVKEGDLSDMWRQAAEFHIRNGHPQVAANSLEELLRTNPNDKKTVAQLVLACSQFDPSRSIKLSKNLTDIYKAVNDVDVEALESSNWINVKKPTTNKTDSLPGTPKTDGAVEKKRRRKKRKGKLPKNYDPNIPPDPERWLPKYERTGYRKKRDRRAKDVIKGSQGTASGQSDQFDFSSKLQEDLQSQEASPSPKSKVQQPQKKPVQKKKNKRR